MREAADRLLAATEARRVELGKKWMQVFKEAGVTHQTLNRWRHGHPVAPLTERSLERALLWGPGAREAIAAEKEPDPLDTPAQDAPNLSPTAGGTWDAKPSESIFLAREALRRVVRSSAKELGVTPEGVDEVMRLVRRDLEETAPSETRSTDLSDLVRVRRAEMGMSLEAVAAATVDPGSGERLVEADWLDRLERAALDPSEYPEYPQLDALVAVLHLDPAEVQDAAGAQFTNVHTVWSDDDQVRGLAEGELNTEDAAKMQELMRLYRKSPQRRDG
ncbi:hypothetical protein GCM10010397_06110 [Streptomyces spinoverrucosus]|nr:hypothetical protein GCM10010397_06110 [Streptomyces spinoverrucosus]